eukprot:scaffold1453_cov112-Isochrysis_galbana.AAC.9
MYTRCVLWSQVACSLARDSRIPCAAPREKQQATTHHPQPRRHQAKQKATTHKCCACASRLAHLEPHANTRGHHHQQAGARNTPRVRICPSFLMPSPSHHQPITATISHITTASFALSSAARSTCPNTAHPMHILCTLLAGGSRSEATDSSIRSGSAPPTATQSLLLSRSRLPSLIIVILPVSLRVVGVRGLKVGRLALFGFRAPGSAPRGALPPALRRTLVAGVLFRFPDGVDHFFGLDLEVACRGSLHEAEEVATGGFGQFDHSRLEALQLEDEGRHNLGLLDHARRRRAHRVGRGREAEQPIHGDRHPRLAADVREE